MKHLCWVSNPQQGPPAGLYFLRLPPFPGSQKHLFQESENSRGFMVSSICFCNRVNSGMACCPHVWSLLRLWKETMPLSISATERLSHKVMHVCVCVCSRVSGWLGTMRDLTLTLWPHDIRCNISETCSHKSSRHTACLLSTLSHFSSLPRFFWSF